MDRRRFLMNAGGSGLRPQDVQIETYPNSGPLKSIRLTHIPTGKTVSGVTGKSIYKSKESLMALLEKAVIKSKEKGEE